MKDYDYIKRALETGKRGLINAVCKKQNVNARNEQGEPVIISAVSDGNGLGVKLLLKRGADINITDRDGRTLLMRAVIERRTEILKILCYKKYKDRIYINATDNDGWTAMNFALINNNVEAVEILEQSGGKKATSF